VESPELRTRLLSYFRAEYPADKGARILREAADLQWEYVPTEFASLLEELKRIKRYRPRLNVAGKRDARHFAFIRVARGAADSFRVVRGPGNEAGGTFFGPFHGAVQLEEALRELNDALGLRDCALDQPMHFADQPDLFAMGPRTPGCIRHEIGKCLGPCVAAVRRDEYAGRFALAQAFLEGANDVPVAALEARSEASARLEFEWAGHCATRSSGWLPRAVRAPALCRSRCRSCTRAGAVHGDDVRDSLGRVRPSNPRPAPRSSRAFDTR
jgi:excinuclease ABC subunit C